MSTTSETQETATQLPDATAVLRLDTAVALPTDTTAVPQLDAAAALPADTANAPRSDTAIPPVNARGGSADPPAAIAGALTGTLIGFKEDGRVPLVLFPGQRGSAAVSAASTIDVHGLSHRTSGRARV